jgi:tetratricopeptide (TPR) repeat protein
VRLSAAALILALDLMAPEPAHAFRDVAVGAQIRNRDMRTLEGKTAPLLTAARANVFVFFRAGQEHSAETLAQIAKLEAELREKPVRFVGIVSDADAPDEVAAMVRAAGVRMPILVDARDALYGELGVSLHPSVGITNERHKLVGYQHFRRINLLDILRGRIQVVLGEISEAQLAALIEPPAAEVAVNRARARVNLAKALLSGGDVDGALASARAAVALEPTRSDTHAILAETLAQAGKCEESTREASQARFLDPRAPATSPCKR